MGITNLTLSRKNYIFFAIFKRFQNSMLRIVQGICRIIDSYVIQFFIVERLSLKV